MKFKSAEAVIMLSGEYAFHRNSCVLSQILNISIKFQVEWSSSKEMATDF